MFASVAPREVLARLRRGVAKPQVKLLIGVSDPYSWEPRGPRIEPRRGGVGVILLALALAAAGIVFAARAFRGTEQPPRPATTIQNGKIAFAAYSGGHWQIFSIEPDGSERSRLSGLSTDLFHPTWSPDGSRIAFDAQGAGGRTEIDVMDADGSNVERLTEGDGWSYLPAWSPDGSRIVFVSNRDGNDEIYVMDAAGSNQVRLTDYPGEDLSPAWSPDGARIAFQSNRGGNNEILVMSPDGTGVRNLSDAPLSGEFDPAWSPDGTKIAFASDRDGNPEIYVMNADGSVATRLTNDPGHDWNPTWAPDGSRIVRERPRRCHRPLHHRDRWYEPRETDRHEGGRMLSGLAARDLGGSTKTHAEPARHGDDPRRFLPPRHRGGCGSGLGQRERLQRGGAGDAFLGASRSSDERDRGIHPDGNGRQSRRRIRRRLDDRHRRGTAGHSRSDRSHHQPGRGNDPCRPLCIRCGGGLDRRLGDPGHRWSWPVRRGNPHRPGDERDR
jgi:hypothetical protein